MVKFKQLFTDFDIKRLTNAVSATPEKKALSLTFGFYAALFPVFGLTTFVGLLFAFIFKLKHYLVQGMNILFMPLQILLIYPFLKFGRMLLFDNQKIIPEIQLKEWFLFDNWETFYALFESVIGGIVIWSALSLTTFPAFYFVTLRFARKVSYRTTFKR